MSRDQIILLRIPYPSHVLTSHAVGSVSLSPHGVEGKGTYAREEDVYLVLSLAPVHGPHDDGSYQTYHLEAGAETDLSPLSYVETSRLIENLLFFLLLLVG